MSDEVGLDDLVKEAALAGATDILLAPGTVVGKLIVRAAGDNILSRVVDPGVLRSLSVQIGMRTGTPALLGGETGADAAVSSFTLPLDEPVRVRVICISTPTGPMVRMRLQPVRMLAGAANRFRVGDFGGLEVLPFLHSLQGCIFVAGPTSAGKTSALHHLAASLPQPLAAVVSEAEELDLSVIHTLHEEVGEGALLFDEMDETDKLRMALEWGQRRLVLATMTSPNLEAALRRIRAATDDVSTLIGVMRVGWSKHRDGEARKMRTPQYIWHAIERHAKELCPCCGQPGWSAVCGRCGCEKLPPLISREVLERMDDIESFRRAELLEDHLGQARMEPWQIFQ